MTVLTTKPAPPPAAAAASSAARDDLHLAPQQVLLALVLLFQVAIFGMVAENFLTAGNLLTVARQNVELGLVALALTPVILTGGIDLSVGSLIGLCAVVFGMLSQGVGLAPWAAGAATLIVAGLGGGLNALLVTRGRIPPLIVTLGTFALFRGIAEGLTRGQGSYGGFSASFLWLGQGTIHGIPTQLWVFVPAAVFFYLLVHRSTVGRELSAIGFAPEARGTPGSASSGPTALPYVLAGLCSGVAALIYVARIGQAKADAALGFELQAITAVVLGGTSIFGGRASVIGTLLGLFAIAFLENGQALAGYKRELTGILVGVMLLATTGLDFTRLRRRGRAAGASGGNAATEEPDMRNSQLAVLCAVIVAAALIVTGGNYMLVNSLKQEMAQRAANGPSLASFGSGQNGNGGTDGGKRLVIGMMPKSKGNAYFIACEKGAGEAAKELNVDLLWDGPTMPTPPSRTRSSRPGSRARWT